MAWLQKDPSGNFHISFRFGGKKFKRSLQTKRQRAALAKKGRLEENIELIKTGRLDLPTGVDIPMFLLSDGKLSRQIVVNTVPLGKLLPDYFAAIPVNGVGEPTLKMMQIHGRHLERLLGKKFDVQRLSYNDVQGYVNRRAREPGIRGRTISASTIKKELTTFRNVWNWAIQSRQL